MHLIELLIFFILLISKYRLKYLLTFQIVSYRLYSNGYKKLITVLGTEKQFGHMRIGAKQLNNIKLQQWYATLHCKTGIRPISA